VYSPDWDEADKWKTACSFTEVEFFPSDFGIMKRHVMMMPQGFFWKAVLCAKMLEDPETKSLI
jgi:hypothetical protein